MKKLVIYVIILGLATTFVIAKADSILFTSYKRSETTVKNNTQIRAVENANKNKLQEEIEEDGYNFVSVDSVIFHGGGGGVIKLGDLDSQTALMTFGTPLSQESVYSEVEEADLLKYHYIGADLTFFNGELYAIEVYEDYFGFDFKLRNGTTLGIIPGTEMSSIYDYFPHSSAEILDHQVHLFIKSKSGIKTDAKITLGFVDNDQDITRLYFSAY
ncbi:hypothetical protein [Pedobacter duraquae]|uniref:Uncharacterized protein n=1 Tax=Pedobacter duraquae TaxID=425511 RepID=A0A4R6ICU2_9SPHI|nr:hypothetical protein [Pedobacter duraquae]TDO19338.1 hypothetical protein CLV32_4578 [Pedobacter duraquae]